MSDTPPQPDPPAAEGKTYTQEDIDKLLKGVRADGRNTGRKEVLGELGYENPDDIKSKLSEYDALIESQKTEAERARDEAAAAKAEAEQAKAAAEAITLNQKVQLALLEAGAPSNTLADITRMVVVEPSADDEAVAAAVGTLKERVPQLFAAPEGAPPAPSSAPAGGTGEKTRKPSTKSGLAAGAERWEAKHGK